MKILLMMPINRSYIIMPSLGIGYIASVLRETGHDVKILHCLQRNFTFDDFQNYIKNNDFDLIGIQMFSYDETPTRKHIDIIRKFQPDTIIVLGGYHPSGIHEEILKDYPKADFALICEVEIAFPKLLSQLQSNNPNFQDVPNLIWRKENKIIINPIDIVEDLDTIPFPAWDLMDPRNYPPMPHGGFFKSFPIAPIIITRGCPMECTFCASKAITTRRIRKRSIENVIKEMKFLKRNFGVRDFLIEDENLTLLKNFLTEFCETLIKLKMNITWSCPSGVRIDTLDEDMLKLMERSGCHSLAIGLEFGSQRIHDITKKHLSVNKIIEKMKIFNNSNIKTTGFFMFGIPGETKYEMLQTIGLSKLVNINRAQFNNFMPLPGSELYKELMDKGMKEIDYDHFFVHDVGYVPDGMTRKMMKNMQRRAYLEFYLRPKIMIGILKEIQSLKHFWALINRFIDSLK
ncbi:MAG: radical SAM protein [Promethearchaeota archaeon]|nr:MAG: radical SAM protein [Candidatus Lokiarchaeota archaeon]